MGTRSRLLLMMVIGVLGETPPGRPPGFSSMLADVAECPTCGTESTRRENNRYWCRTHGSYDAPPAPPAEPEQTPPAAEPEPN